MNRVTPPSKNEQEFIKQALGKNLRVDGRKPYDYRAKSISFAMNDESATVQLGSTRTMAVVTAEIGEPYPDRPSEGTIQFRVEFSPMASQEFEPGRPGESAVEVSRIIERSLRDSMALDTESLVILSGLKVWHVKCDIHVLDHDGNLTDACSLAALAALTVFRRPDVTVGGATGKEITVHPKEVKEPVPLTIHHIPLAVTLALFQDGTLVAVDPCLKEEATMEGHVTVVMNKQQELCSVQKGGGIGIPIHMVEHCISVASAKVQELTSELDSALQRHATARVQARVRRHAARGPAAADAGGAPATGKGQWRAAAVAMRVLEQAASGPAGLPVGASPLMDGMETDGSDDEEGMDGTAEAEAEAEGEKDAAMAEGNEDTAQKEEEEGEEGMDGGGAPGLPQGALLMPAVVQAAGLTGSKSPGKPSPANAKKKKKKKKFNAGSRDEAPSGVDDFADIAAVIAEAATRSGAPGVAEGLQAAIKPQKKSKKARPTAL